MNNSKLSSICMLKILGCFIFDIALILAFLKTFGLFLIIAPFKSILILFVLLLGLMIINIIIVFSDMLFNTIGIPYTAATVTLAVLYVILANILSIFLIPGSIVWYTVWQFVIFAVFVLILSVIAAFSNKADIDNERVGNEQDNKDFIMLQLLEIEDAFFSKEDQESIVESLKLFKTLKERIRASTPFGRIINNNAVYKVENQIKSNLASLRVSLQENYTDKNLLQLQKLLEDTNRIVINREKLNIQ